jgi:hypothetical protein
LDLDSVGCAVCLLEVVVEVRVFGAFI